MGRHTGRRARRFAALRSVLAVVAALAAAAAAAALVLLDESRDLRVVLCATVAAGVAVGTLLAPPATRPHPALAARRRRGVAGLGRLLVRVFWLLRVGANGAAAWFITWNADSAEIQPLAAGLVALSMVLLILVQVGQHLAGLVTALDDLRGRGLLGRAATIVAAAAIAGSAGYIAAVVERCRRLVVDPVWDLTRDHWGLPVVLAGLVTGLVTFVVVTTAAGVAGIVMLSVSYALGPRNAFGRWLAARSPVQYARSVDSLRISVIGFTYSGPAAPTERTIRRIYRGVRYGTGPLELVFVEMLLRDVAAARAALVPPGGRDACVVLRAAGDHEEVVLGYELPDNRRETLVLHGFSEVAALRRLRLAFSTPLEGLPSQLWCADEGWTGAGVRTGPDSPRRRVPLPFDATTAEPDWCAPPRRDDLVREVVCHPPGPPWVRERLGLPAADPGW